MKAIEYNFPLILNESSGGLDLDQDSNDKLEFIKLLDVLFIPEINLENNNFDSKNLEFMADLTSSSKIIRLQEEYLDGKLFQEQPKVWEENDITPGVDDKSFVSDDITTLILSTSQEFVISPLDKNYYQELQDILPKLPNPALLENKSDNNSSDSSDLGIIEMNFEKVEYSSPLYILQDINSYQSTFNHEIDTEKYERISQVVHNQIVDSISVYQLKDQDRIEITLRPESLGVVKIKCEIGEKIVIDISSDKFATLSLLQNTAFELKEIITNNIIESNNMEMNFSMERDNSSGYEKREHYTYSNNSSVNTIHNPQVSMHFSHNGVINFIV